MDQATHDRINLLEAEVNQLKSAVAENTKITKEINSNTGELLELFKTAKGGFRVAYWMGNFFKWVATLAAAAIGMYLAIREAIGK